METLNLLVENPGFQHLALAILEYLDPESLAKCQLVSQNWEESMNNLKPMVISRLRYAFKQKSSLFERVGFKSFTQY